MLLGVESCSEDVPAVISATRRQRNDHEVRKAATHVPERTSGGNHPSHTHLQPSTPSLAYSLNTILGTK